MMLRPGHVIALIVIALMLFGIVMVNSAGLSVDPDEAISLGAILTSRHAIFALAASACLVAGAFTPVRTLPRLTGWSSPALWIVLGSIAVLIAAHLPVVGYAANGANRWVNLGLFRFQASEVAKWGLPVVLAIHGARCAGRLRSFRHGFLPPMLITGVICGLIVTADLGTALLVGAVAVGMLLAAGVRRRHVALTVLPAGAAFITLALIAAPYRLQRITSVWGDPYADAQGSSYHIVQSMAAVSGGGLAGRGLGASVQKYGHLPEDRTDFIYAIICEELGAVGAVLPICLYLGLLIAGRQIIRRAGTVFEQLLAFGILMTVGLQAAINLTVVTGLAPTKGIALPLLSAGGTGWMLTAYSLGLLIAMERAADADAIEAVPALRHDPALAPAPETHGSALA